eukprot:2690397-Rhodomonas_salina.1
MTETTGNAERAAARDARAGRSCSLSLAWPRLTFQLDTPINPTSQADSYDGGRGERARGRGTRRGPGRGEPGVSAANR